MALHKEFEHVDEVKEFKLESVELIDSNDQDDIQSVLESFELGQCIPEWDSVLHVIKLKEATPEPEIHIRYQHDGKVEVTRLIPEHSSSLSAAIFEYLMSDKDVSAETVVSGINVFKFLKKFISSHIALGIRKERQQKRHERLQPSVIDELVGEGKADQNHQNQPSGKRRKEKARPNDRSSSHSDEDQSYNYYRFFYCILGTNCFFTKKQTENIINAFGISFLYNVIALHRILKSEGWNDNGVFLVNGDEESFFLENNCSPESAFRHLLEVLKKTPSEGLIAANTHIEAIVKAGKALEESLEFDSQLQSDINAKKIQLTCRIIGAIAAAFPAAWAGVKVGAMLGAGLGGAGALPGAIIGGVVGAIGGGYLGYRFGNGVSHLFSPRIAKQDHGARIMANIPKQFVSKLIK